MEAATEMLEAKFQKAESDLNHLTRKLELRCQDNAKGDTRKNPLELLRKVNLVKDEYKALVKEAVEIEKAQAEAMDFFRSQLPLAMQALQQLQHTVGLEGSEDDRAKVQELETLLGASMPSPPVGQGHTATADTCGATAAAAATGAQAPDAVKCVDVGPSSTSQADNVACQEPEPACSLEDPVAMRGALRAGSGHFVEVGQEEFESVSDLIRGRVKLSDVNSVYRCLYTHFKEEENSQVLSTADMHKLGMRVTGATGKAKLKVLRALKLLTLSSKEEVKLL